jgi:hypothetical protein
MRQITPKIGGPVHRAWSNLTRYKIAIERSVFRALHEFCGETFDPRQYPHMRTVRSDSAAGAAVVSLAQSGVHFIKVHDWLTRSMYMTVVEKAAIHGIPVVGRYFDKETMKSWTTQ